jgi:vacuolar-type H+-ATPase subunit I/STV1
LMKKVTIITPPEYEGMILESLGRARITQLKHITGSEFDGLEVSEEQSVDYKELYERVQTRLIAPIGLDGMNVEQVTPNPEELKEFARDPYAVIDSLVTESNKQLDGIRASRENVHVENNKLVSELQEKLQVIEDEKTVEYDKRLNLKTKLDSISALEPDELKNCFAAGVVKTDFIPNMNEYLTRYPNTYSRVSQLSKDESLLFVFGNEESKKWIDALFLVYDIKDIYDVLDPADVLLVLDESKRREAINKYRKKLSELNVQSENEDSLLDGDFEKRISELKEEYNSKIEANEAQHKDYLENLLSEQKGSFGIIQYYANILWVLSRKSSRVLRGKVISIIQGYVAEKKTDQLREIVAEAEIKIGERVFVEFSDLDADDNHAPVPEKDFGSEAMQPLWILTRLRGWPSAIELNPGFISVIIFCFQFGLMYGDIGQGLVFLALGLALNGKYKEGMMKYLFALLIPMGIAAIIFGVAYDSIFLYEHEITHWLEHSLHWVGNFDSHHHLLSVNTPFGFKYPIMPNPMKETGELMNLIFKIGAIELIFGSMLGAYNAFKAKNYAGMIGEHGLGMGLYVLGLYLSAATMFTEGLDIMAVVGAFPFKLMLIGMLLSFIEPMVHSLMHGHGIGGMEAIGQGIGGLLLTFVEGLANMFSFLRVAAFAIAHVSLSSAGAAMGIAINSPVGGMVIMNIIALTFEFVSSSVQSIRLLYYEFMGKFFHGEGNRFKPFKINPPKPITE